MLNQLGVPFNRDIIEISRFHILTMGSPFNCQNSNFCNQGLPYFEHFLWMEGINSEFYVIGTLLLYMLLLFCALRPRTRKERHKLHVQCKKIHSLAQIELKILYKFHQRQIFYLKIKFSDTSLIPTSI